MQKRFSKRPMRKVSGLSLLLMVENAFWRQDREFLSDQVVILILIAAIGFEFFFLRL